jgi:hypothetical protein
MPVTAKISTSYLWRLGFITAFCFGFALWFLYDGTITYPRQRERALKYQELVEGGRLAEWRGVAAQRGWPLAHPGEPKYESEIYSQLAFAALMGLLGLVLAIAVFRARGRWIELNETGLRASWGRQFEFGQITVLDKRKWGSKGIARIRYQEDGRNRQLVLDDCKYEADPTLAILREVESRLNANQIVGGLPEPPVPEAQNEADSAGDGALP